MIVWLWWPSLRLAVGQISSLSARVVGRGPRSSQFPCRRVAETQRLLSHHWGPRPGPFQRSGSPRDRCTCEPGPLGAAAPPRCKLSAVSCAETRTSGSSTENRERLHRPHVYPSHLARPGPRVGGAGGGPLPAEFVTAVSAQYCSFSDAVLGIYIRD